jgi:hypothetical protein
MTFCKLEKDKKTFEYVKQYLLWYSQNHDNFLELDSQIQLLEIKNHLENNNYDDRTTEMLDWIKQNSEKFRIYLNTIKIFFTVWYCSHGEQEINWEEFCFTVDKISEIKGICLDDIMLDANPSNLDKDY